MSIKRMATWKLWQETPFYMENRRLYIQDTYTVAVHEDPRSNQERLTCFFETNPWRENKRQHKNLDTETHSEGEKPTAKVGRIEC